ncbi:MAG: DUF6364 family protein [Flavobacterium sp.]|uniref:DUF6364 family protein n=1 Tax=Flavobacterium sp. TaxID=239 RepID=UPI0026038765|nr:DUF6364 family protein [Flavobacterium sp.]MDD5150864.1 DUF6364 family protein [Flavobacterium sp.]
MNTKLTLSLEKKVIEGAKIYAKGTGRSLSEMVENYFKSLISNPNNDINNEDAFESRIKKITGIVNLPPDFDEKKAVQEYLEQKYLK